MKSRLLRIIAIILFFLMGIPLMLFGLKPAFYFFSSRFFLLKNIALANPVQQEAEEIYSLTAYAIAFLKWVPRGTNIAALLTDRNNRLICWAVRAEVSWNQLARHAELELFKAYSEEIKSSSKEDSTIYTTLEPCAMCSGHIVHNYIRKVIYGQTDLSFGKTFARLNTKSFQFPVTYPFRTDSAPTTSRYRELLEGEFKVFKGDLGKYLSSEKVRSIFKRAKDDLESYKVVHKGNNEVLRSAHAVLKAVASSPANTTYDCNEVGFL